MFARLFKNTSQKRQDSLKVESVAIASERKAIETVLEGVKANIGYDKHVVIKYKRGPWVVTNMQANSYMMKASVITIYNPGYYAKLENKSELKTTLTHEFGHLIGRHSEKTRACIGVMMMGTVGITAKFATHLIAPTPMGIIVGLPMLGMIVCFSAFLSAIPLSYMKRQFEFEADNAIVKYCSRAEIKACISKTDEKFRNQREIDRPKIRLFETHPSFWDRYANMKKQLQEKDERERRCMRHAL